MSIFAGAFARRAGGTIPNEAVEALRASVSRHPDDPGARTEFRDGRCFVVKVDVGALGQAGTHLDHRTAAFVAGDPIYQPDAAFSYVPRVASLQALAGDLAAGTCDALRACRGTYCAAVYDREASALHLVVDKVGVRPLYCWVSDEYLVFATALRILEAVAFCPTSVDLQGAAEIACFGYALSDRSPYEEIFALLAGESVRVDVAGLSRHHYWRWDELPAPAPGGDRAPQGLYKIFRQAVGARLRGRRVAAAFLSGGLDSRAIVAALKAADVEVFTANFAPPGSQDEAFGQLAADRLGSRHAHLPKQLLYEGDAYSKQSVAQWLSSPDYLARSPEQPRVVWSGDGGSVGLGHVYLNSDIVAATRSGDPSRAARDFLAYNRWGLESRLLNRELRTALVDVIQSGIVAELASVHPPDPGRSMYLFLMLNDQRRHMFNHFENIDLGRIEFELPFFDGEFITAVMREPIDSFLRHCFYLEWLECFPGGVLDTPWQAYPGHVQCTLPMPEGLSHQWDSGSRRTPDAQTRRAAVDQARVMLRDRAFADAYLDAWRVRAFAMAMRWGRADRSYLVHAPSVLYRFRSRARRGNACR